MFNLLIKIIGILFALVVLVVKFTFNFFFAFFGLSSSSESREPFMLNDEYEEVIDDGVSIGFDRNDPSKFKNL